MTNCQIEICLQGYSNVHVVPHLSLWTHGAIPPGRRSGFALPWSIESAQIVIKNVGKPLGTNIPSFVPLKRPSRRHMSRDVPTRIELGVPTI
jgi:hypothetical protein